MNRSTSRSVKIDPAATAGGSVWDRLAHRYDRLWVQKVSLGKTREAVHQRLDELIRKGKTTILDLGCGTGQLLGELAQKHQQNQAQQQQQQNEQQYRQQQQIQQQQSQQQQSQQQQNQQQAPHDTTPLHLIGVDKSSAMIREARKRHTGAVLHCLDVSREQLKKFVAPESLDVVVCCHSFPYYTNKEDVLQQLREVLRPDGSMIFVQASINGWYDRLVMALIEKTAERADYLSREAFKTLVAPDFEVVEEFHVRVQAFMPSICGFVMRKRSDR
jgi:ubiquinone/menaquinone biosynthesis C-methylase UbiE